MISDSPLKKLRGHICLAYLSALLCSTFCIPQTSLEACKFIIQEVFHVYLNKFENAVSHLFLFILGNN